jgi:integrase
VQIRLRIPSLRRHARGAFFVRLPGPGGRSVFFGSDPKEASAAYARWLRGFVQGNTCVIADPGLNNGMTDRETRPPISISEFFADDEAFFPPEGGHGPGHSPVIPASRAPTFQVLAQQLFALKDSEVTKQAARDWRTRLNVFLSFRPAPGSITLGERRASALTSEDAVTFKASLAARKPTYANGILTYSRALLKFAYTVGAVDREYRFIGLLSNFRLGVLPDKGIKTVDLIELLKQVARHHPTLARMMLLQFYTCARPSELPRLVHREGTWKESGVFQVESKTTRKTGELRSLLLCDAALTLLNSIDPTYQCGTERLPLAPNRGAYAHLCAKIGRRIDGDHAGTILRLTGKKQLGPHALRHSAKKALTDAQVREDWIRVAMGRVQARVDRTYGRDDLAGPRKAIAVLTTLIPSSVLDVEPAPKNKGGRLKSKEQQPSQKKTATKTTKKTKKKANKKAKKTPRRKTINS